ncbi:MAG: hypothetical protein J7M40_09260 [Planctomycetes bacterium]|nr:hypothetical protein [Planctomycetota bacterium]
MKVASAIVLVVCCIAASAQGELFSPTITNPSFEDDVLTPGDKTQEISDWWNRTAYCWAAEEGNADFPETSYGANWAEFGNLSWVYQQIGTWEAGRQLHVSLLIGSISDTDFPGLHASLWAGGDAGAATDGSANVPTTLESAVGATQIAISDLIKPTALHSDVMGDNNFLGTGQASEESVILSTGSDRTPGEPLWLLLQSAGRSRVLIDNIRVIYLSGDPMVINLAPGDYAEGVDPNVTMRWDVINAASPQFDISIGTTTACDDVLASNTGSAMEYIPPAGILNYGTTYFWRVDITDEGNPYPGPVWRFTTGGKADSPVPQDGGTADRSVGMLSWADDALAASYDVYFGQPGDLHLVDNYTTTNVSFADLAQTLSQGVLVAGDYQWRVDTRDAGGGLMAAGDVWDVTIPPYEIAESLILEDFASYNDSPDLLGRWVVSGSGSIGLDDIYGSMAMQYDNASEGSSVEAAFEPAALAGWTYIGMKSLSISFKGDPGNAPQPLYVVISDGENSFQVTHEDIDAVRNNQWRQWDISLADFVGLGLDPTKAVGLAIGVGGSGTGSGAIFIDDIVLYPTRCLDEHRSPADVNADCVVDGADLVLFAADWLESDYPVSAAEPSNDDLVAAYDFEEETGTTALDSSGNDFNATIDPNQVTDYRNDQGRRGGRCLKISRDLQVLLPQDAFADISDEMTVSVWTRSDPAGAALLQQAQYSGGPVPGANALFEWDHVSWDVTGNAVQDDVWNHWAAVKDAAGQSKIYHNGVLVARNQNATAALAGIQAGQTTIKLDSAGGDVYIDELKIYREALLHEQIVYLASVPGGAIVQPLNPLLTSVDINTSGKINLTDLAICARDWLAIQSWPE